MKLFDPLFKSSNDLVEIDNLYLFGLGEKDVNIPLAHKYILSAKERQPKCHTCTQSDVYHR